MRNEAPLVCVFSTIPAFAEPGTQAQISLRIPYDWRKVRYNSEFDASA